MRLGTPKKVTEEMRYRRTAPDQKTLPEAPPNCNRSPSPRSPRSLWSGKHSLLFAQDSAGPSGLRLQHIKGDLLPGCRDELLRSLHAVVRIMAEGNILGPIVSWIASASLTAFPKKDGSHWRVAVGETLRRLTAKALLAIVADDTGYVRPAQMGSEPRTAVKPSPTRARETRQWTRSGASGPRTWRLSPRLAGPVFFGRSDEGRQACHLLRLVILEQQPCLFRPRKDPESPLGPLLFALGLNGDHLGGTKAS